MALGTAKNGAQRAAALLPAGDEQLPREITAIFALAVADIHRMDLDEDQALALVYGLSNERVNQKQIAAMAHWANMLADTLPVGAAQSFGANHADGSA